MSRPDRLLDEVRRRPPTLGEGRLLCLDGRAGSGKTTLADRLERLTSCTVIHLDDLYDGWGGLLTVQDQLGDLLGSLAEGKTGSYRRYDWHARRYRESVEVRPTPLLVLEGVGSYAAAYDAWYTLVVWLELPERVRRQRAIDRDGDVFSPHWSEWAAAEEVLFARERTQARADLVCER
ncbi:4-amino-4-deoxy-L-arabinose transferase [Nocardioides insulae]|uniref:4-amino-4-deoxy-L-arabinose transferase n=1 Tax=Nocardioides insulae TaxID=394734 RepID=UPI0004073320|nr:4-amino-4-deoxy-L-arabinose transferase [Nocardioides insulae]